MLNCAICDDDKSVLREIRQIMENALRENECVGHIQEYTDSRLFLYDIMEYKPLDLVVIDIEMPHFNGMQVACEIKKHFPECCVIFLTSYIKYAVESYELQIFRYAPKSAINTKLPQYMKEAIRMLMLQNGYTYTILKNDNLERLPYNQMLCVRKDGKYSVITCVDNREIRIRKPLREVIKELDTREFIMIDRGCIVNIALVSRVSDYDVICKNGDRLPISRAKLKETKSRITQYWGKRI